MKRFWKVLSMLLVLVFTLTPTIASAAESSSLDKKDLSGYTVILHTNDTHGRAIPDSYNGYMGFTAISALKKHYQAAGAEVILLDAGDTLHGLPFANLERGESIVQLMNLAGYDAMTPGNHDFNYGTDTLLSLSKTMKFPLLSANVTKKEDGSQVFNSSIILEKNGVKYGIFGVSTNDTAFKTNPNNVKEIEFNEPMKAATAEVAALKGKGADVIIALTHLGTDESSLYTSTLLAQKVDGIDVLVDGHSHSTFENGFVTGDTLLVSTGEYLKNIGVVTIDPKGNKSAELINGTEFIASDAAMDAMVKERNDVQNEMLSEEVGYTSVYLDGEREHARTKETNLGNLTADAMREATGADVALTNGGGIRDSIKIGDITKKDLVTVFPFGNYVVTEYITGEVLLQALEVGTASYPDLMGSFPQVSGITFTIDVSKPGGKRVTNAKVNGAAIDPEAKYLFASNDFLAVGGDGYTMLADFPIENEYGALEEILISYITDQKEIKIETEDRISLINENSIAVKTTEETDSVPSKDAEVPKEEANTIDDSDTSADYIVVKGDHLWKIAKNLYGSGSRWMDIYEWNKDTITNPDELQIGQKLILAE